MLLKLFRCMHCLMIQVPVSISWSPTLGTPPSGRWLRTPVYNSLCFSMHTCSLHTSHTKACLCFIPCLMWHVLSLADESLPIVQADILLFNHFIKRFHFYTTQHRCTKTQSITQTAFSSSRSVIFPHKWV